MATPTFPKINFSPKASLANRVGAHVKNAGPQVHYVNGLPLGLKVLGCFLYGKIVRQWESELHKLEREPNQEIQCVLKRSYDELDCPQQ